MMKKKVLIITVISVLLLALAVTLTVVLIRCGADKYEYDNEGKYTVGDFDKKVIVGAVDIEWFDGRVEVVFDRYARSFMCTESSEELISNEMTMRTWFDGNVLRIRPCASGIKADKIPEKTLTVYVPMDNMSFNSLRIVTDSASVSASGIGADFFNVDSSSGNVDIEHIGASKRVSIHSGSGNVNYSHSGGRSEESEISSESGSLTLSETFTVYANPDTVKDIPPVKFGAHTSSGNIILTLPADASFTLDMLSEGGITSSSEFSATVSGGKLVVGEGREQITLRSSSGNIFLKKSK